MSVERALAIFPFFGELRAPLQVGSGELDDASRLDQLDAADDEAQSGGG